MKMISPIMAAKMETIKTAAAAMSLVFPAASFHCGWVAFTCCSIDELNNSAAITDPIQISKIHHSIELSLTQIPESITRIEIII